MFDLRGHVALVTGGNSGIGLGMARGLVEAGAQVAIWGTNAEKNTAAVAELGDRARAYVCDVGEPDEVTGAFAAALADFGRIDSCFANAGIGGGGPITEWSLEAWRRVSRVNLDGLFLTLQAAASHMIDRGGGGSLVVTSSTSAIHGAARNSSYAATKTAGVAIARALAVELARYGIRVNAILPGWVETAATEGLFAWDKFSNNVMPRVPVRRWGTGDDFKAIAVYLASPESSFHTGDAIVIDGGYTIF
jgi:NAD(P)-dependent dehydrogenase (short-subunit alcohol dehydrogenase family)